MQLGGFVQRQAFKALMSQVGLSYPKLQFEPLNVSSPMSNRVGIPITSENAAEFRSKAQLKLAKMAGLPEGSKLSGIAYVILTNGVEVRKLHIAPFESLTSINATAAEADHQGTKKTACWATLHCIERRDQAGLYQRVLVLTHSVQITITLRGSNAIGITTLPDLIEAALGVKRETFQLRIPKGVEIVKGKIAWKLLNPNLAFDASSCVLTGSKDGHEKYQWMRSGLHRERQQTADRQNACKILL